MTVLVAAFAVVFLAGSAFAFTGQGPLTFNGTVGVSALMQLEIVEIQPFGGGSAGADGVEVNPGLGVLTEGVRSVDFEMSFDAPVTRALLFTVENTGTLPAQLYDIGMDFDYGNLWGAESFDGVIAGPHAGALIRYLWRTQNGANAWELGSSITLNPGETVQFTVTVEILGGGHNHPIPNLDSHFLTGYATSTLTLNYRNPQ